MSLAYQYLIKSHQELTIQRLYTNDAAIPHDYLSLLAQSNIQVYTSNYLVHQHIRQASQSVVCHFSDPNPDWFNAEEKSLLIWPKAKPLAKAFIELCATETQNLWVLGENHAGGKSINNAVKELCSNVKKQDSARKCSLWQLSLKPQTEFDWQQHKQSFEWQNHQFFAFAGVFSQNRLDTASQLLLEHVDLPKKGVLLDVACGSGILGLAAKLMQPDLEINLYDVDALALKSAQLNADNLNLNAHIQAADMLEGVNKKADVIICNPPFHQGIKTDYNAVEKLLGKASACLKPNTSLWLVANQHLPYENMAKTHFKGIENIIQAKGFKLLKLTP